MLIVAPTPLLAANFVMMGRIVRRLGVKYSRLSPRLCEWCATRKDDGDIDLWCRYHRFRIYCTSVVLDGQSRKADWVYRMSFHSLFKGVAAV